MDAMNNNGANDMTRNDLTTGLNKDLKDLATYEAALTVLRAGMAIENMTVEGAEIAVDGLKACVANKEAMIARLDAIGAPESPREMHSPKEAEAAQPTFDSALAAFVAGCQAIIADFHNTRTPALPMPELFVSMGQRYAKIIRKDGGTSSGGSVHCFVDRTNGDVLKASSWKAPAKHARGNIYRDDNGLNRMDQYGTAYLR